MHYYTTITVEINGAKEIKAIGLASFYGPRNEELFKHSSGTYWTAQKRATLQFIPVESIKQLIMMAPDPRYGTHFKDGQKRIDFT